MAGTPTDPKPAEVIGPDHEPHHLEVHHEDKDINVRAIATFAVVLAGIVGLSYVAMWALERGLIARDRAMDRPVSAFRAEAPPLPPEPRLQAKPRADMAAMRAEEQRLLSSYGWTEDGHVRIPIDRAIELVARRGLPVREGAAAQAAPPLEPDEAGLGIVEKR